MSTGFENFSVERFSPPTKLELLAKEVPDLNLDIQYLDSPMGSGSESSMEAEGDIGGQLDHGDQVESEPGKAGADGVDACPERSIICRNESLEGEKHPITGVPFERKEIEVKGEVIEGVFPEFDSAYTVELPEELHEAGNREQFNYANNELRDAVESDPELREKFSDEQLEQIENGDRPDGYVWHHSENPGELQLVDRDTHDRTGHTGGQVVWGGGSENR